MDGAVRGRDDRIDLADGVHMKRLLDQDIKKDGPDKAGAEQTINR